MNDQIEAASSTEPPPPGWYADPEMVDTQRYWDGAQWTENRAPGTPAKRNEDDGGLVVVGYVTSILIPIMGFIIGIVLITRRKVGHGVAMMIIALAASSIIYFAIVAASEDDVASYTDCVIDKGFRACEDLQP